MKAIITVIGKDTVGILAKVSDACAQTNVNIVEVTQSVLQDMFAMIMLVLVTAWLRTRGLFPKPTEQGVLFWSALYIPIVIAMASTQNVAEAIAGGPMAILAGVAALAGGAALVPVLSRIGGRSEPLPAMTEEEKQEV